VGFVTRVSDAVEIRPAGGTPAVSPATAGWSPAHATDQPTAPASDQAGPSPSLYLPRIPGLASA